MSIGKFKPYKNIVGTIEMEGEKQFHGKLLDISGFVDYQADSLENLEEEFHRAVDDYLNMLDKYI